MKKKVICLVVIMITLLIFSMVYFKPLSFSDITRENDQIKIIYNKFGVRNGEAYIDSVDYQNITLEQKKAILTLFDKYIYRRTFGTLFSNGATSGLGDKTLFIYMYDDVSLINSIYATSSGKIVVNEKNYSMKNAEHFIEQVIEIISQTY